MDNKPYILLIDDSNSSLLLMEWLVVNEGYTAILAESVKKALEIIKKDRPGLILLDLQMPEVSGYDFLKMRDSLNIQNVPIIVVSAFDTPENIELTKTLGASEFLGKPIKTKTLLDVIKKFLP
jgi:DNA-binding NtrC family response regulator